VVVESTEDCVGQRPLGAGAECAEAGGADCVGGLLEEFGSLGCMETGSGKGCCCAVRLWRDRSGLAPDADAQSSGDRRLLR
jgi:hypothetical protein